MEPDTEGREAALAGAKPRSTARGTPVRPSRVRRGVGVRAVLLAALLLIAGVPVGLPPAARAQVEPSVTIDFDDAPANRSGSPAAAGITDRYAELGVVFTTPVTPLVYDAESIPALPDFSRSGSTVITTCYSVEFCSNRVELALDQGHEGVGMYVGYGAALAEPAEVVVEGFGPEGLVAATGVTLGPSDAAVPVEVPVSLADPDGTITDVVVRWADPSRSLDRLAIDDLGLTPFVPRIGLAAKPTFLFLDGSAGEATGMVEVVNVGNVEVPIADVAFNADDPAPSVSVVDTTCLGVLPREGSCRVDVAYDPVPGEVATGLIVVSARDGSPLLEVDVEAAGPAAPDDPTDAPTDGPTDDPTDASTDVPTDDPTDPTDPGEPTETAGPTDPDDPTEPGETPSPDETVVPGGGGTDADTTGTDPDDTPPGTLAALLVAGGGFVALLGWWRRRRPGSAAVGPVPPPRPPLPPDLPGPDAVPVVGLRARPDGGRQAVQPAGGPVVGIRARLHPERQRTTLHDPAMEEGRPR